ncbi:MAG: lipopolysaccharide biosynthesis protein RfbH [Lachnospiraceae bacterium]|nr:lipopolysaccharide biosynthesis protein RfbH [Lachnospiraceae bacterium]
MFENMSEKEARNEILRSVREYCDKYHRQDKPFTPGDRIPYASRVYGHEEMENLVDSALEFWLTAGRYADRFEKGLGEYLGLKYVSLVNSGSSANLLAVSALTSPLLGERRLCPGDEVITVAAGFPTTVGPVIQCGAVPVFVDVKLPCADIDVSLLEEALSEKTKAVILAHTLGNPFDIKAVKAFTDRHGLWLIEDNCDSLGSRYTLDGKTGFTGTFGDIGTSSFYPPHHMTMGEGGAVYTNDPLLHRIVRSLRDWGRDCICPPGRDNFCGHRFDRQYGELPVGYDHKYVYSHFGYNLKATDMQAAVGCAQLEKFPSFAEARRKNFRFLKEALAGTEDVYILPEAGENADPCWFGFLITVREGMDRTAVIKHLEQSGVQTRMLFAGNLTRHPCMTDDPMMAGRYRVATPLTVTDRIMRDSFWVGLYPGMDEAKLGFMAEKLREIRDQY